MFTLFFPDSLRHTDFLDENNVFLTYLLPFLIVIPPENFAVTFADQRARGMMAKGGWGML